MEDSKMNRLKMGTKKMIGRTNERLKQKMGRTSDPFGTKDEKWAIHVANFNRQQASAQKLHREVKGYIASLKTLENSTQTLLDAIREMHEYTWPGNMNLVKSLQGIDTLTRELNTTMVDNMLVPINNYMEVFPDVKERMNKRDRKLLDFTRCKRNLDAVKKGDKISQNKLGQAQEEYSEQKIIYDELNSELCDDLPEFFNSRKLFISKFLDGFFKQNTGFHKEFSQVYVEAHTALEPLKDSIRKESSPTKQIGSVDQYFIVSDNARKFKRQSLRKSFKKGKSFSRSLSMGAMGKKSKDKNNANAAASMSNLSVEPNNEPAQATAYTPNETPTKLVSPPRPKDDASEEATLERPPKPPRSPHNDYVNDNLESDIDIVGAPDIDTISERRLVTKGEEEDTTKTPQRNKHKKGKSSPSSTKENIPGDSSCIRKDLIVIHEASHKSDHHETDVNAQGSTLGKTSALDEKKTNTPQKESNENLIVAHVVHESTVLKQPEVDNTSSSDVTPAEPNTKLTAGYSDDDIVDISPPLGDTEEDARKTSPPLPPPVPMTIEISNIVRAEIISKEAGVTSQTVRNRVVTNEVDDDTVIVSEELAKDLQEFEDQLDSDLIADGKSPGFVRRVPKETVVHRTSLVMVDADDVDEEVAKICEEDDGDANDSSLTPFSPSIQVEPGTVIECIHEYKAVDDDELSFVAGDLITVVAWDSTDEQDEGWFMGIIQSSGTKGAFPINYTRQHKSAEVAPKKNIEYDEVPEEDNIKEEEKFEVIDLGDDAAAPTKEESITAPPKKKNEYINLPENTMENGGDHVTDDDIKPNNVDDDIKPNNVDDVIKPNNVDAVKADNVDDDIKPNNVDAVKADNVDAVKADNVDDDIKPNNVDAVKPNNVDAVKPNNVDAVKADNVDDDIKPNNLDAVKADNVDAVKADVEEESGSEEEAVTGESDCENTDNSNNKP